MREGLSAIVRVLGLVSVALTCHVGAALAIELVTAQEAALPDAEGIKLLPGLRGITRGPSVAIVSPAPGAGAVRSPLNLVLKFESHGGAAIDPSSITMTYLKKPALNLTQRISRMIKPAGIEVHAAEVPPGIHYFRIEVKDEVGRTGSTIFALAVMN